MPFWFWTAVFLTALLLYVFVPRLVLGAERQRLQRICRAQNAIAITFDDGPGRLLTPLVVARLAQAGLPATFFLLARSVRGNEDLVDAIRDHGHELGSHGNEHVHHVWSLPWTGILDTAGAWRRLRELTGRDARRIPFRPPFGKLNLLSLLFLRFCRTPVAMWTHDSFDTNLGTDLPPHELARALRDSGGGVVLLHDFDRSIPDADTRVLAKLDAVIALQREGFRFVRVGELMRMDPHGPPRLLPAETRSSAVHEPENGKPTASPTTVRARPASVSRES
jgi:peptidoglycan-N-acetylglucosamine deacetylase